MALEPSVQLDLGLRIIDSKLYPQFQADVHDAWHLMRNLFDANALSLTYGSSVQSLDQFTQAYFGFLVGLDHHADDGGKDHLISGLNTTGSLSLSAST